MIEYLYDAIRATAGRDIRLTAKITDEVSNTLVTTDCSIALFDKEDNEIYCGAGGCVDGVYYFTIPASAIRGLKGRFFYCIRYAETPLTFKQPIYLV
jgi:hypothetical protein